MERTLLTIRVVDCGDSLEYIEDIETALQLGLLAQVYANVRIGVRRSVGQIERDMECGGVFAHEVTKNVMRLMRDGPATEQILIQEVPSDGQ